MKRTILSVCFSLLAGLTLNAQITINTSDLPVLGDTLRYSIALPSAALGLSNTGANITWDYKNLVPRIQGVDTYKTASQAGYTGIGAGAYGFKISDSLGIPGAPVTLNNVYNFFSVKTSPSRFVAEGFAAKINNVLPLAAVYSDEDEWYFLPLTFMQSNNSTFKLSASVLGLGTLKMQGTRATTVDGWGTIETPFTTAPVPVLRIRSEVDETDSIVYNSMPFAFSRHSVDYKWMANGQHYPMLWITTTIVGATETPTSVRYRDSKRNLLGIAGPSKAIEALQVYPNPATGNEVTVKIPASWNNYKLHVYDATGKLLSEVANQSKIGTTLLPPGMYTIIAECNGVYGATQFVK